VKAGFSQLPAYFEDQSLQMNGYARRAFFAYVVCAAACVRAAVTVSIPSPPASVPPGQSVSVNVQYNKPASEVERRLVFIVELKNASTGAVIAKGTANNSNLGFTTSAGTVPVTVAVPAAASGQGYFQAYAVPWSLNRAIVAHYKTYPTNGTFTYLWSGGGYGVTQNVYYLNTLICPKPAGNTTYCSGLAFEAWLVPYNAYNAQNGHANIGGLSVTQMQDFRRVWYGVTDAEKLAARAIPEYGLGVEITNFEEAQEGDFVQLWRHSTSGHNPVFVNWIRNASNVITGVRYWGSQGSTSGIGYNTESFGNTSGINSARFYLGRLRKPRDQADYTWSLGTANTQATPTSIGTSTVDDWKQY
jgi:hypothetical protein